MTPKNLRKLKDLAKAALGSYKISSNGTKIDVLSFDESTEHILQVSDEQSIQSAQFAIDKIIKGNGDADFEDLISYIKSNVRGIRGGSQNILTVFTQGNSINPNHLERLKATLPDIKTVVVTIGDPNDILGDKFDAKIVEENADNVPKILGELEKNIVKLLGK